MSIYLLAFVYSPGIIGNKSFDEFTDDNFETIIEIVNNSMRK